MRALTLLFILLICSAFTVPTLTGPVVDKAGVISRQHQRELEEIIRRANDQGKIQLQILTVTSLDGETIEQASIQVTDQWKLGTAKEDNGVLLMVSQGDRKVRIEVGQGLEGIIPDAYASRIVRDVMIPLFKEGQYSLGIYAGALQVLALADPGLVSDIGKQQVSDYETRSHRGGFPFGFFVLLFFLILFLMSRRFRGAMMSGRRYRSGWGGGLGGIGGGSWGSGGGGWSGGGGGFSGGGASGGW